MEVVKPPVVGWTMEVVKPLVVGWTMEVVKPLVVDPDLVWMHHSHEVIKVHSHVITDKKKSIPVIFCRITSDTATLWSMLISKGGLKHVTYGRVHSHWLQRRCLFFPKCPARMDGWSCWVRLEYAGTHSCFQQEYIRTCSYALLLSAIKSPVILEIIAPGWRPLLPKLWNLIESFGIQSFARAALCELKIRNVGKTAHPNRQVAASESEDGRCKAEQCKSSCWAIMKRANGKWNLPPKRFSIVGGFTLSSQCMLLETRPARSSNITWHFFIHSVDQNSPKVCIPVQKSRWALPPATPQPTGWVCL